MKKKTPAKKPASENTGPCAYPDCKTICDSDNFCHGCHKHTCEKHSTNFEIPWGGHPVEAHWEENEEEEW